MTDYPNIRADSACPFCHRPKDNGGIACWPCFRAEGLRYDTSPDQRTILDSREAKLAILAKSKPSLFDITLTAWVQGSPNAVPVATAEFRSESLATDTERVWKRNGFRVERKAR
jgi:hypothetical protein